MRSRKLVGRAEDEDGQHRSVRAGRSWRVMSRLRNLRIRTRFFLGLGLLALVAVAASLVGFLGLAGMNRLLEATHADDRAMVRQLTETRSHLAEAVSGLGQSREPGDAEALS